MPLMVETSGWSLALRRDSPPDLPEIDELGRALDEGEGIVTTGLVVQGLLQRFSVPKASAKIVADFASLPLLTLTRSDHVDAAALRRACRRGGVQLGTNDALIAQLCIAHGLTPLTTDRDFDPVAKKTRPKVWRATTS